MNPVNQFILGDSMFNSVDSLDAQIQKMEAYRNKLQQMQSSQQSSIVWDDIDMEINPMTDEQKSRLFNDEEYFNNYSQIQNLVQKELLNLVKAKIESTPEGKELLQNQLKIVRNLKGKIVKETNQEMELFRKFKEYSKQNPGITYEEFIKNNIA